MADQKTTDAAVSGLLKTYYNKMLIDRLEPKTRLYQLGKKEPIPMGTGKVIEFTGYRNMAPILENSGELSSEQGYISAYTISSTLIQRHNYVKVSTLLKQTSIDKNVKGAVSALSDMMARTVDLYLRGQVVGLVGTAARSSAANNGINSSSTYNNFVGTITGNSAQRTHIFWSPFPCLSNQTRLSSSGAAICTMAGSAMSFNEIRYGVSYLESKDVEPTDSGEYIMVSHPLVIDVLKQDPKWATWNAPQNARETFWKGEVGMAHNTRILKSTTAFRYVYSAAPLTTASGAFNASLLTGKDSYGVSELTAGGQNQQGFSIHVKNPGPNSTNDPVDLFSTVGGKMVMTATVLNKSSAVCLITQDKVVSSAS